MTDRTTGRGRPRSAASRDAILRAAFAVLAEHGYAGMTIESVAEAAGASRTTIYRWWSGRADLAVDAFFHETRDGLALPDTGSTAEDFRLQILELSALLRGPRGAVFAAMLGGSRGDLVLARALGERWLEPRRRWGVERMMRAIQRGECRAGVEIGAALGLLYGPIYTPLLFGQDVPPPEQIKAHLALALPAVFRGNRRNADSADAP